MFIIDVLINFIFFKLRVKQIFRVKIMNGKW